MKRINYSGGEVILMGSSVSVFTFDIWTTMCVCLSVTGCGILAFFFVVVKPEDVDLPSPDYCDPIGHNTTTVTESTDISVKEEVMSAAVSPAKTRGTPEVAVGLPEVEEKKPIGILQVYSAIGILSCKYYMQLKRLLLLWLQAILIPGVIEFSLCLFFSKAVYYTFFFWLPVYIKDTTDVGNHHAADLSVRRSIRSSWVRECSVI